MTYEEDFEFLGDVGSQEMKAVVRKWAERKGWEAEKAENNTYAWLSRIRERVQSSQKYLNTIYALQKKSSRIRKFTTPGALQNGSL